MYQRPYHCHRYEIPSKGFFFFSLSLSTFIRRMFLSINFMERFKGSSNIRYCFPNINYTEQWRPARTAAVEPPATRQTVALFLAPWRPDSREVFQGQRRPLECQESKITGPPFVRGDRTKAPQLQFYKNSCGLFCKNPKKKIYPYREKKPRRGPQLRRRPRARRRSKAEERGRASVKSEYRV